MRAVRLRHQLDNANALGTGTAYREAGSIGGVSRGGRHATVRVEDTPLMGPAGGRGMGGAAGGARLSRRRGFPKSTKCRLLGLMLLSILVIGIMTVVINQHLESLVGGIARYETHRERRWYTPWRNPSFRREGEWTLREPARMPGFHVVPPTTRVYTPEQLDARFRGMDLVYTFVNGTEANHGFRRQLIEECGRRLFLMQRLRFLQAPSSSMTFDACPFANGALSTNGDLLHAVHRQIGLHYHGASAATVVSRDWETDELRHSLRSVETHMRWHRGRVVLVSPGHHPQWVDAAKNFLASRCRPSSPRTSAAGRNPHPHVRVTTVHQDALLPYGMHLTLNSHTVEKYLWRVHNLTSVHLYFNDDYFVNRDTAVTDFVNSFGGTIIRTEREPMKVAHRATSANPRSWDDAVGHTTTFTTMEVDIYPEDHLSSALISLWHTRDMSHVGHHDGPVHFAEMRPVEPAPLDRVVDLSVVHKPDTLPPSVALDAHTAASGKDPANPSGRPITPQYVVAHAPFTYCTAMHRFLANRYTPEYFDQMTAALDRNSMDLLMPFVYNAFIMTRPWAASPSYMRYLAYMHEYNDAVTSKSRRQWQTLTPPTLALGATQTSAPPTTTTTSAAPESTTPLPGWEYPPRVDVQLDNEDGCAPATHLAGLSMTDSLFTSAGDDAEALKATFRRVREVNPLFFNVNGAFSEEKTRATLRQELAGFFPDPVYLEGDVAAKGAGDADDGPALRALYDELMALPLVLVTSYAPGVCPLVRSLQLSLADHRGPVLVVVHRAAAGEDVSAEASVLVNETLSGARRRLRHRVYNGMPVLRCTFRAEAVRVLTIDGASSLQAAVARAVHEAATPGSGDGGVVLPERCGGSGARRVRGFVVDARARRVPPTDYTELVHALTMPGQTLALEDFATVPLARNMSGVGDADAVDDAELRGDDVLLSLSVTQAESGGVHWVFGASESDLLLTYPLPVEKYEDMNAELKWLNKEPSWEKALNAEDQP